MKKYFYLKKVIAEAEEGEAFRQLGLLAGMLDKSGIECSLHAAGQPIQQVWTGKGMGELWVTDNPDRAKWLSDRQHPFLVYFHPGNRGEDFSMARHGMERPQELGAEYLENVYRRCRGIPWDIAETKRCFVRETRQEDVDSFCRIYSDPSIRRYLHESYPEKEEEKECVRAYIDKQYSFYNFGVWTVLWKETGEIIGRAGFSLREGYEPPELGYMIAGPWQRQGIAYEICEALLDYARDELGFEYVQALVEKENEPSLMLCCKLGFRASENVREEGRECVRLVKELL